MSENIYPKVSAFETSGYGVSASPKFPKLEEAVLDYWKKDETFQASIDNREAGPHGDNEFVFYEWPSIRKRSAALRASAHRLRKRPCSTLPNSART